MRRSCVRMRACRVHRPIGLAAFATVLALASAATAVAARSLYQAPLAWRNDRGESVTLDRWKGTPVVLTMVFTSCQATCPLTMGKLVEIQKKLDREKVAAEFVIVSFDPAVTAPFTCA